MGNQWFRLYAEFATDPKVQMLSEADQRRFIMLLCLKCSNVSETFHDDEVAFQLRIGIDEWRQTKAVLMKKNMVDDANHPIHWDKRQFASDSSTARVRKHREALKNDETFQKRSCNALDTETDTETDTDTETETSIPPSPLGGDGQTTNTNSTTKIIQHPKTDPDFMEFWFAYPKKTGKRDAVKAWTKSKNIRPPIATILEALRSQCCSDQWIRDGGQYIPNPATWINQGRWDDEPVNFRNVDQRQLNNYRSFQGFMEEA